PRPPRLVSPPRPAVRHPTAQRHRRDAARQHAAGLQNEAPAFRADLRADGAVQARRDRVERVLYEGALDGRATAVPDMSAEPDPQVRRHGAPLGRTYCKSTSPVTSLHVTRPRRIVSSADGSITTLRSRCST